jgi:tRNA G46 methylase TrmB
VKHVQTQQAYLQQRPIAAYNRVAFDILWRQIDNENSASKTKLILDSGCGTGKSSLVLGLRFPDCLVIGVDRSIARLQRNPELPHDHNGAPHTHGNGYDGDLHLNEKGLVQQVAKNVWLVRASLVDFWRCLGQQLEQRQHSPAVCVQEHYLLYPNPYPKLSRLKQRWYAHPAFLLLLSPTITGERLIVRSNWRLYLEEFATAAAIALEFSQDKKSEDAYASPNATRVLEAQSKESLSAYARRQIQISKRSPQEHPAWTNFEQKYDNVGETTYELILETSLQHTSVQCA